MALFDKFKKKQTPAETFIDDITFIQEMKHIQSGPWHQYDVLLAARGYGWEMMIDWADYMGNADLENISQVTVGQLGMAEKDITEAYHKSSDKCSATPELQIEQGFLSIAGISKILKEPMKIIWFNQTRVLRFFTPINDEILLTKYVETVIRRTFGTPDEMRRAKPIPKNK